MTAEPLMLSDTAMVLLRRYMEIHTHFEEMRQEFCPDETDVSDETYRVWHDWLEYANPLMRMFSVQEEFLRDVYLLWLSRDMSPVRHLDWHLVLSGELIAWAEKSGILIKFPYPRVRLARQISLNSPFMTRVIRAYKQSLTTRIAAG